MTDRHTSEGRTIKTSRDAVPRLNVSGAVIPAYGVVQFLTNYSSVSQASKPEASDGLFFANGPADVAIGARGESQLWMRPRRVLLDGLPTVGDEVGPVADSWAMSSAGTGFRVFHQPVSGIGVVTPIGGGGSVEISWGRLDQDSGRDDALLSVTLFESADLSDFTTSNCGGSSGSGSGSGSGDSGAFLDMDGVLCTEVGTVVALVPAGYKAGIVGLIKHPVCGSGSGSGSGSTGWGGWVVVFGDTMRCVARYPVEIECCPIEGLKFTRWSQHWYFGGPLEDILDPCTPSSSGSGS